MNDVEFIEKYCKIKDKNSNKILNIHLSNAQKKFIEYLKKKKL